MKVKPETPETVDTEARVATTLAVPTPLPSSRKWWGCGVPSTAARAHLVSRQVTVARSTCG